MENFVHSAHIKVAKISFEFKDIIFLVTEFLDSEHI